MVQCAKTKSDDDDDDWNAPKPPRSRRTDKKRTQRWRGLPMNQSPRKTKQQAIEKKVNLLNDTSMMKSSELWKMAVAESAESP